MQDKNKKLLKKIARKSIKNAIQKKKDQLINKRVPDELKQKRGVFVTLYKDNKLRGCIGKIKEEKTSLYKSVAKMAKAAALNDNRFLPVKLDELKNIKINISILSPLKKTKNPKKEIELGKHGVFIKKNFKSGVFLPEVAQETNWDLKKFMNELCKKAGLKTNDWQTKEIEIYKFTTKSI